jgi:hypothetical protein
VVVRGVILATLIQIWLACRHMAVGAGLPLCFRVLRLGIRRSYAGPSKPAIRTAAGITLCKIFDIAGNILNQRVARARALLMAAQQLERQRHELCLLQVWRRISRKMVSLRPHVQSPLRNWHKSPYCKGKHVGRQTLVWDRRASSPYRTIPSKQDGGSGELQPPRPTQWFSKHVPGGR